MTRDAAQAYRIQSVMTASPARQVALLLDRAIASLKEACRAIDAGQIEQRCKANARAMEIICQLAMALDFEQGREIAMNLHKLYRFMLMRLPAVDLMNDAQTARDVIGLLEPLRSSWHELADRQAEENRGASQVRPAPAVGDTAQALASRVSVSA